MIIYPLPASELDDKTLSRQIKNIADTLTTVHYLAIGGLGKPIYNDHSITEWTLKGRANYDYMVKLGIDYCEEWGYRFEHLMSILIRYKIKKYQSDIDWVKSNKPDVLGCKGKNLCTPDCMPKKCFWDNHVTPFPLLMPDKYIVDKCCPEDTFKWIGICQKGVIDSYRNCYRAKLEKGLHKKLKCKKCKGTGFHDKVDIYDIACPACGTEGYITQTITPTWSRRSNPAWFNI